MKTHRPRPRERHQRCLNASLVVGMPVLLAVLTVPLAHSAEWSLQPDAAAGGIYNDNPRLDETGDENEIWGGFLGLALTGQRRTQTSLVRFRPRLYFDRYDDSDEDSDDQFLDVFAVTRGQRNELGFFGNISNQQVRRGEDADTAISEDELDDDDKSTSGRVDRRRDRLRWRVKPVYTFSVSERTRLGASFEYVDVDYNNEQPGEAEDYNDSTAELFVERKLSEKSRLTLTGFASKYESDEIYNDSKSFGGRVRYERDVSETYSWYVDGGAQTTDIEAGPEDELDESQTSYIFTSGIFRDWERTRLQIELSRSVDPSGTGFLKTRDGLRLNLRHQLRPRWYGRLNAYVLTEDNVDDTVDTNKRDYAQAEAILGWEMSPAWSVQFAYRYTYQDYDDTPGDADSNTFRLGVAYGPTKKIWSR